jgi:radical SAM enzyme (TIGR01210 family)
VGDAADSRRVRELRSARPVVDPWRPLDVKVETERGRDGRLRQSMTVFLAGSECPFTCVFCDLWQYTLTEPTPLGALARQLDLALGSAAVPETIKLYNASNFFDDRAVPVADRQAIAKRLAGIGQVTVECHPRLVGEACLQFAEQLDGGLEVAMGLETVGPEVLPRLNKQMSLEDFARATDLLRAHGIGIRVFVLLSPPFVESNRSVEWCLRSIAFAQDHGADVVAVIPTRGGNGEMERLAELGEFSPPTLEMLEETMSRALGWARCVVLADLWDVERLAACAECGAQRRSRLVEMNRTGEATAAIRCPACQAEPGGNAS